MVKQRSDYSIVVEQRDWIDELKPMDIGGGRKRGSEELLDSSEIRELRGLNGKLMWYAKETRPDMLVEAGRIAGSLPAPRVKHARALNKAVEELKRTSDVEMVFQHIPPSKVQWITAGDASWASNDNMKSQGGWVTVAAHEDVSTPSGGVANVVAYRSWRMQRVTPSTLDAEAIAINTAVAENQFQRKVWEEFTTVGYKYKHGDEVPGVGLVLTDAKSLYDVLNNGHGLPENKRTALEVISIREYVRDGNVKFRWIPTSEMIADALTKEGAGAKVALRKLLQTGNFAVVERKASDREKVR
jgi:hypothetical protein